MPVARAVPVWDGFWLVFVRSSFLDACQFIYYLRVIYWLFIFLVESLILAQDERWRRA